MALTKMALRLLACAMVLNVSSAGIASAAPHIPTSGAQVLERLPTRNDPLQKALAGLRSRLQREPANLVLAAELARRYIELARNDADPRYLGYAQAVLAPWWGQARPPPDVLVPTTPAPISTTATTIDRPNISGS